MKRWAIPLGVLLALSSLCGTCLWSLLERPRFSQTYDIGGGRTLTVWSIRRDLLLTGDADPNPLMVYYRIDAGSRELVHTTFLDFDDEREYRFRVVVTADGMLACVYEVERVADSPYYLLMYDVASGESWPRIRDDETKGMREVIATWRERYRRIKAEFPDLPAPETFDESASETGGEPETRWA